MIRRRSGILKLMVAIVIAGTLIGAWDLQRRRATYRDLAASNASLARLMLKEIDALRAELASLSGAGGSDVLLDKLMVDAPTKASTISGDLELRRQQISYFIALTRKYERAAEQPWLAVPPDPPFRCQRSDR